MKVSICIPIYGVEAYIERCARSLFAQTYQDIEFIFVNDCTKDNSISVLESVIESFPNRKNQIKIINHEVNRGLSCARYTGIMNSSGDYLYHIDSDDWIDVDTIKNLVDTAKAKQSEMVVGRMILEFEGYSIKQRIKYPNNQYEYISQMVLQNRLYPWNLWNRLIRRNLQMQILPINGLNMGEDYATVPRLCAVANKIDFEENAIYHYRQNNISSYTNTISHKSFIDLINATNILCDFFSSHAKFIMDNDLLSAVKLKTKAGFYIISDNNIREKARNCFTEKKGYTYLSFSEKILLILGYLKLWKVIDFYVKGGIEIKSIIKRLRK